MISVFKRAFESIQFAFSHLLKGHKGYIAVTLMSSLSGALLPFVNLFAIRSIIEEITTTKKIDRAIAYAIIMLVCNFGLKELSIFLDWRKSLFYIKVTDGFFNENSAKFMRVDFKCMENPDDLNQMSNMYRAESVAGQVLEEVCALFASFLGTLGSLAIIASLHPLFMLLMAFIIFLIALLNSKAITVSNKIELQATPIKRFGNYLSGTALDPKIGKEVRLFLCKKFFMNKIERNDEEQLGFSRQKANAIRKSNLASIVLTGLQTFCLYGYMSLEFIWGAISISQFSLYLGSAKNFADCILRIIQSFIAISAQDEFIQKYRSFGKMPETLRETGCEIVPLTNLGAELEFRGVWFKYPSSDSYILENINFKITAKEKISVVGENGAGKTTLIKLICRLYSPTKGSILLNGRPLEEYDYDAYMRYVATVFQDFRLFSFTIRDNLDCTETRNDNELAEVMERCGILSKIRELPQGIDSHLHKGKGWEAVELSGGEYQKLAIARAYLKNAGIVIMDEPTAALDPISEYNIYLSFNELMEGKNAFFISHRMSSSIFCDRILFIANKTIAEMGTHEELLFKNGQYAEMFSLQASTYR